MERFEYEINDRKKLIVTKTDEGLVAHVEPIVYDFSLVRVSGTIRSSLFETLASTGESPIPVSYTHLDVYKRQHQVLDGTFRSVDEHEQGVRQLAQIVRRDVRRHADGDAGRTVQ